MPNIVSEPSLVPSMVVCPGCGQQLTLPRLERKKRVACLRCHTQFVIAPPTAVPSPPTGEQEKIYSNWLLMFNLFILNVILFVGSLTISLIVYGTPTVFGCFVTPLGVLSAIYLPMRWGIITSAPEPTKTKMLLGGFGNIVVLLVYVVLLFSGVLHFIR